MYPCLTEKEARKMIIIALIVMLIGITISGILHSITLKEGTIRIDFYGVVIQITPEVCAWSYVSWIGITFLFILSVHLSLYLERIEERKRKIIENIIIISTLVITIAIGLYVVYMIEEELSKGNLPSGVYYYTPPPLHEIVFLIIFVVWLTVHLPFFIKSLEEGEKA